MSDDNAIKFTLRTPIQAHGEEVKELSFREPTSQDLVEIGTPVRMETTAEPPVVHDERRMSQMMARLAAVPPSSILKLHPLDFLEASWLLTPFFVPRQVRI